MREKIRAFRRWFNEQSLRERGLLTLVVLVAAFMAWDLALMGPMRNQDTTLHDTVASLRAQVEALESETDRLATELQIDPNEDTRDRTDYLGRQIQQLDTRLEKRAYDLIPPTEMARVLREVLRQQSDLRLVRLESLPVEALFKETESEVGDAAADDDDEASAQVFRHGVVMELRGGYMSTLRYLEALEELPWRFFFQSIDYEVLKYPEASITLTVHSVSMEEAWIGV
jgi:MSHA biogenesis protein MshJ